MSRLTSCAVTAITLLLISAPAPAQWPPTKSAPPANPPAPTSGQPSKGQPAATPPVEEPPAPPPVDESMLGGPGESCRARVDCKSGLKCLQAVCVDPHQGESCMATSDCGGTLRCIQNVCGGPAEGAQVGAAGAAGKGKGQEKEAEPEPEDTGPGWSDFRVGDGVHGFAGLVVAPGLSLGMNYASGATSDPEASFFFGLRGGVYFGTTQLALELAPVTFVPSFDGDPVLTAMVTVGTQIELADRLYWPLRFGAGVGAVNTPNDNVWFASQLDLLGIGYNLGHLTFEGYFPSFRHYTDFDVGSLFTWLVGAGINYVF